ncbi:hypothetical protein FD25_GL002504 [Levilactobacillus acidifarinae DSM 19394]|uniref:Uncharacterized protein n=2 Tax=Levilactobacillus acidifarinae TaxID=267364 RepID=A0A0R1LJC3_9LACO|nr:hypothetical protein FD25_GL002504 [Levilactobacillus acidifarinae DSM 19394]
MDLSIFPKPRPFHAGFVTRDLDLAKRMTCIHGISQDITLPASVAGAVGKTRVVD